MALISLFTYGESLGSYSLLDSCLNHYLELSYFANEPIISSDRTQAKLVLGAGARVRSTVGVGHIENRVLR